MRKTFLPEILVLFAVLAILVLPAVITAAQERPDDLRQCKTNLKQLGLAIGMYMCDYNEAMPPNLQILVDQGYMTLREDPDALVCPAAPRAVPFDPKAVDATTGYYYARLKDSTNITRPGVTPIAWDRVAAHPDGLVVVLYADLHVAAVSTVEFEKALSSMTALYLKPPVLPVAPPAVAEENAPAPSQSEK